MNLRRVIHHGYRKIESGPCKGSLVRQGSVVEELDPATGEWVYVDCMHPDDADRWVSSTNNLNKP